MPKFQCQTCDTPFEVPEAALRSYKTRLGCPLKWIEAHCGYRWNEYADSLSTAWMRSEV